MMNAGLRLTLRGLLILAALWLAFGLFGTGGASAAAGHGLFEFGSYPGSPGQTSSYSTGTNPLFYWSELEPSQGAYNWGPLDQALSAAAAHGKTVIPRVYTNVAGFGQATPSWVFNAGAKWYYNSDFSQSNGMRQPVPTDPVFTAKFATFLTALGARYNGDPRIEFFQTNAGMGEYGEMVWGWPDNFKPSGWSPEVNLATVKQWIDRWTRAFPSTKLVIMLNCIGWDIAEDTADYAVSKGWYLQQNDYGQDDECRHNLFNDRPGTRHIMEIEGAPRTGQAFENYLTNTLFKYVDDVDYLVLHSDSFTDPQTASKLPAVEARLRSSQSAPPPAPPPPPAPSPKPSPAAVQSSPSPSPAAAAPAPTPTAAATPPPSEPDPRALLLSLSSSLTMPGRASQSRSAGLLPPAAPDLLLYSSAPELAPGIREAGAIDASSDHASDIWIFAVISAFAAAPVLVRVGWRRFCRVRH